VDPIRNLLIASAFVSVAWTVVVVLLWYATMSVRPRPGPPTSELGDEPPAIVNLLTEGFRVTPEAPPATLLDLAARGHVRIELGGGGSDVVTIGRAGSGTLTPYEQHVTTHVERLARGGIVPSTALTTGRKEAARSWWRAFRREVIAEAHARGLAVPRWRARTLSMLVAVWVFAALVFYAGMRFNLEETRMTAGASVTMLALAASAGVGFWLVRPHDQRETFRGLEVAGRWLGLRAHLAENEVLRTLPPSAVAVWGRHLAYAAAMDLAPGAVTRLPLGAEDDRVAWSDEGGRWRQVRIRYPRLRPGWGVHPGVAIAVGFAAGSPAALLFWALWPFEYPDPGFSEFFALWAGRLQLAFGWVLVFVILVAAILIAFGVTDLSARRVVDGTVLRLRTRPTMMGSMGYRRRVRYFAGVDDGTVDTIAAVAMRQDLYARLAQRERARLVVTTMLGYVSEAEPR